MTQTLSIRLGSDGPYFDINGDSVDPGLDPARYDEFEGGNVYLFYGDIAAWADDHGVTHIIDENLLELGILTLGEFEEPITLAQYYALSKRLLDEACN
jgi:hypothetical protein